MNFPHRTWAEIDLAALRHNVGAARRYAGSQKEIMAVVKADAYGHGLPRIVAALRGEVNWFGVSCLKEAVAVAEAGGKKVFMLGPVLPDEREEAVERGFVGTVSSYDEIRAFEQVGAKLGKKAIVHVAVDTGMGRMGCLEKDVRALLDVAASCRNVRLEGIATHFPSADEDDEFTHLQIANFRELLQELPRFRHIHLSNSAGLLKFETEQPFATMARPGLMLYGISPLPEYQKELRPMMTLKTRVTQVRDLPAERGISYGRTFITEKPTRAATLATGYGDGYPRHLSGQNADVLLGGRRCSVLGRVTMDQIVVDVSGLNITAGDEAVLMGPAGEEIIPATELARKAGTIPWEIVTRLTQRVPRVYMNQ